MKNNELKNRESPKTDGRGQYMVRAWEEAKKVGGIAYSPQEIDNILNEEDGKMLTREEVQGRIGAYFKSCVTVGEDEDTGEITYIWKRNPTKSGLALALGVAPATLIEYVKGQTRKGEIYKQEGVGGMQKIHTKDFDLLRKAYVLIEDFYEQKLGDNRNNAGVIFWLNNRENTKWSNQQEFQFGTTEQFEKQLLSASELPKLNIPNANIIEQLPRFNSDLNMEVEE